MRFRTCDVASRALLDGLAAMFWSDRSAHILFSVTVECDAATKVSIIPSNRVRMWLFGGNRVMLLMISRHFVWIGFETSRATDKMQRRTSDSVQSWGYEAKLEMSGAVASSTKERYDLPKSRIVSRDGAELRKRWHGLGW